MNILEVTAKPPKFTDVLNLLDTARQDRIPESNWDTIISVACRNHVTINNLPQLNEYITRSKPYIIKQMLTWIRDGHEKWSILYVNSLIRKLHKIEVTWSELAIITRSTRAISKEYKNKKLKSLNSEIDAAEQLPTNTVDKADELGRLLIVAVGNKFTAKQCPKLLTLLDKNKSTILRILYKGGNIARKYESNNLLKFGVTWPELDKSANAELTRIEKHSEELNEVTSNTFTQEQAREYLNRIVEGIILSVNDVIDTDNDYLVYPWKQLDDLRELYAYDKITDDEIQESLGNAKVHLIKYLIIKMREGQFDNVKQWLNYLQNSFGCNWPELNTIKRSLDAEVFKLTESTDEDYETATKNLEALIMDMKESLAWVKERPHANVFPLNNLSRIEFMVRRGEIYRENILPELDSIRKEILTYMLQQIKSNSRINYEIKNHCDELKSLGCIWPELDTIIQSYNADKSKKLYENDQARTHSMQVLADCFRMLNHELIIAIDNSEEGEYSMSLNPQSMLGSAVKLFDDKQLTKIDFITKFEAIKREIIKYILIKLKDGNLGLTEKWIVVLKQFGIEWNEITIIENSVRDEHKKRIANRLDEHVSQKVKAELLNNLANRGSSHLYITILRIAEARMTVKTVPELVELFNNRKLDILEKINNTVEMEDYPRAEMIRNALLKIGVAWPELKTYFDDRKGDIIRHILEIFKDQRLIDTTYCIQQLRKAGITWPELDIIERSTDYEREKRNREEDNLYESALDNISEEDQENILNLIVKNSGTTQLKNTLAEIASRKITVRDWPDLESMLNDYKTEILNSIKYMWDTSWYESASITIQLLTAIGITWPELKVVIDKQKISTIKRLLRDIVDGHYDIVLDDIDNLYRAGCKWPELKTIEKSVSYEQERQQMNNQDDDDEQF